MKKAVVLLLLSLAGRAESLAGISDIKKIVSSAGKHVALSLRDSDGNEVVNFNGDQSLAPASIAKTVSTACSLDVLGPQYQFETVFGMTGKLHGDTLDGDLVVQGHGDPALIIEDLHEIIEKIRFVYGIRKINGNLVFDASYIGQKSLAIADGFEGDEGRSFNAEITPTVINHNSFSVWVAPDFGDNKKTRAVTLPANVVEVKLINKAKVSQTTDIGVSYDPKTAIVTVNGSVDRDGEAKGIYRAVEDVYGYHFNLIHRLWLDAGGEWKNPEYKISPTSVASQVLWKHSSRPLAKLMMDVNKLSLNLGAELIFLAAGVEKYGQPATYEKSLKILKECLVNKKMDLSGFILTNGSGLSREAQIKASALSQFLLQYTKTAYAPEYLSSFGILGVDGTAKSRLKKFAGRARIKTGSLKNVRSIAGYLYTKDNKIYTLAMIQNSVDPNGAKNLEDRVIEAFLSQN